VDLHCCRAKLCTHKHSQYESNRFGAPPIAAFKGLLIQGRRGEFKQIEQWRASTTGEQHGRQKRTCTDRFTMARFNLE
jgi:hypothetical protein